MKKITQILLVVIFLCGCGVKDVDFEYSDKDPESINYDPVQPQITAAAFENHFPVLTIKPGSVLAEGTIIEKSLTAEAEFFAIDTIAVDINRYTDSSGVYSKWLILDEQFYVDITASLEMRTRYGQHRTVKDYQLPADYEFIRDMIYDPAEKLLYMLITGKYASTHRIFKLKFHTEWSFYGDNPFPLK